jgi:hypothetical protein
MENRMSAANLVILDPTAPMPAAEASRPWRLDGLQGKVVGFVDNAKPNFDHLVDALSEVLIARHGVARVVKTRKYSASVPADKQALARVVSEADLIITGSGD